MSNLERKILTQLRSLGIKPKRSLSQYFLIDDNILLQMEKAFGNLKDATCIEIGPGLGAITNKLLSMGALVIAIEKDWTLSKALPAHSNLKIYNEDFLNFICPTSSIIISNLPYNSTSPILKKIALSNCCKKAFLTLQKECAHRLFVKKDALSVLLHCQFQIDMLFDILPTSFYPKPHVCSTLLQLIKKETDGIDWIKFYQFTHSCFVRRGSMLRKSISKTLLDQAGIDPTLRPSELTHGAFLNLFTKTQAPCRQ